MTSWNILVSRKVSNCKISKQEPAQTIRRSLFLGSNCCGDWVVQKYIENALLIQGRKFDIRQWAIVSCWNPLTVWFYSDCYLRFCVHEFSLEAEKLNDRFVHLANNAVSSKSKDFKSTGIEGNMWTKLQLIDFLASYRKTGDGSGSLKSSEEVWETINSKMKTIVECCFSCVQDMMDSRVHSFEVFGFDFMLDEQLNVYLLEVNSSPSMEYSTAVTKNLVQKALKGLVSVVLDGKYRAGGSGTSSSGQLKLRRNRNGQRLKKGTVIGGWELIVVGIKAGSDALSLATSDLLSVKGKQIKKWSKKTKRKAKKRGKRRNFKYPDK